MQAWKPYVEALSHRLSEVLGSNLVGVYVHGSAAFGDFRPGSDLDVLAVSHRAVPAEAKIQIARRLTFGELPCTATELEFHIVTEVCAASPVRTPPFELHLNFGPSKHRVFDGSDRLEGDNDLVLHFAVVREVGVAIHGPAAARLFGRVPRRWVLETADAELAWAAANASNEYRVLTACRAWRYAEAGVICSKTEGGKWARKRALAPSIDRVISTALDVRASGSRDGSFDPSAVEGLTGLAREAVRDSLALA